MSDDMSFCEKGSHDWYDCDIVELKNAKEFCVLVACKKCPSRFLKKLTP